MPEEAIPMVALNLPRIFPHLEFINPDFDEEFYGRLDEGWEVVIAMICVSRKQTVGCSGKERPLSPPQGNFGDTSLGPTAEELDDAYR